MTDHYKIAIIGSGPGGLSAAARAAETGLSHILLERTDHLSDTIFKYQRGKFIMATPDVLPLRSPLDFQADIRENVLGTWDRQIAEKKVNLRLKSEVRSITGQQGAFQITLGDKTTLTAENIILAIGVQGNLRTMRVPGENVPFVQYQLDDPTAHEGETVIVVGAGDAAIENAVALSKQNKVIIVNRRNEFARAKTGNLTAISKAIETGAIECVWNAAPVRIEDATDTTPRRMILSVADGEAIYECDRIIARLGADPPRKFVESCGVVFPSEDPGSFPEVSPTYESNVPGLYIVGALAGYPLIKHCMNQGYEVIEHLRGAAVEPADQPLLAEKFAALAGKPSVDAALDKIKNTISLFNPLTTLQLREFMLDSDVHGFEDDAIVFAKNDYGDSLWTILDGEVAVVLNPEDRSKDIILKAGNFFGEIGLISGRRRSATIRAKGRAVLIETPRRSAIKLINSVPAAKRVMDESAILRQLQTYLLSDLTKEDLAEVVATAEIGTVGGGHKLIVEGETDNAVYVIRSGSVTVSRQIGGKEMVLSYVPAGHYVGEMALVRNMPRGATVTTAVKSEIIKLDGEAFRRLLDRSPALKTKIERKMQDRLVKNVASESEKANSGIVDFLIRQGVGEATDVLLIDESLCVRCDNCEKACAETHQGVSRLNREAGPTFANIHVPTSCRHCEHPHCMADCPPDAIHRAPNGEVFIDDSCIGCGNCERNCPYGVIRLAEDPPAKPGLLHWLLFGLGSGPGEDKHAKKAHKPGETTHKHAVKCDMCKGIEGGPTCVRACPTGAAIRVSPEKFFDLMTAV